MASRDVHWLLPTAAVIGGSTEGGDYARSALYLSGAVCGSDCPGGIHPPDVQSPGLGGTGFHCSRSPAIAVVGGARTRPYDAEWALLADSVSGVYGDIVAGGEVGSLGSLSADAVCWVGPVCRRGSGDFLAIALCGGAFQLAERHPHGGYCDGAPVRRVDVYCLHDPEGLFIPSWCPVTGRFCGARCHHRQPALWLQPGGVLCWSHGGVRWRCHPLQHL